MLSFRDSLLREVKAMTKKIKLGYVTVPDARNILSWSGTMFHMASALESQDISVKYISPLRNKPKLIDKLKKIFYQTILKKRYLLDRTQPLIKGYAQQVNSFLSKDSVDILLSPGTIPLAWLDSSKPLVLWNDCTFAGLVDFYAYTSNLCKESIENGHAVEKAVLERVDLAIFSSDWAANTAIKNYSIDPLKVKVVSYGANIECDRCLEDIKLFVSSRSKSKCQLLFIGVDWVRKGGDVALAVARRLNELNLDTELIVVGCKPEVNEPLPDFVKYLGFIDKTSSEGRLRLANLMQMSHFLILPSKADCTPMVLCEANSFGTPCLSTKVGGIPTTVRDDYNGKLFSETASIGEYCSYIIETFFDYGRYEKLALSSFMEYESRLNWSTASKTVKTLISELVDSTSRHP